MPGDGIGPEVTEAAVAVMSDAAARHGLMLNYTTHEAGAAYYRKTMEAISAATMEAIGQADAVLLGAMGLPDIRYPDGTEIAPQIDMRGTMACSLACAPAACFRVPTRVRADKVDMLVIRELTEELLQVATIRWSEATRARVTA